MSRQTRRMLTGVRAVGQGLLGVALIALAALVFIPGAYAASASASASACASAPAPAYAASSKAR